MDRGRLSLRRSRMAVALVGAFVVASAGAWMTHDRSDEPIRHGSLTAQEYSLAVTTARRLQAQVKGTFIGATAFASSGPDRRFDPFRGSCPDSRLVNIRLVWKKDANFMDLGTPDGPLTGPVRPRSPPWSPRRGRPVPPRRATATSERSPRRPCCTGIGRAELSDRARSHTGCLPMDLSMRDAVRAISWSTGWSRRPFPHALSR
jgi:hypothetical protein